jgi:hypothetical protein
LSSKPEFRLGTAADWYPPSALSEERGDEVSAVDAVVDAEHDDRICPEFAESAEELGLLSGVEVVEKDPVDFRGASLNEGRGLAAPVFVREFEFRPLA